VGRCKTASLAFVILIAAKDPHHESLESRHECVMFVILIAAKDPHHAVARGMGTSVE
jgi:hypothetical protein